MSSCSYQLGFQTRVLVIAYKCLVSTVVISQVSVKKDNGKTTMVPVFQSLETISGEVRFPFSFIIICLFGLSLVFSLGEMASRYRQHQSQVKGLNTWVSRSNCWDKQVCYLSFCVFCQVLQQVNYKTMVLLVGMSWSLLFNCTYAAQVTLQFIGQVSLFDVFTSNQLLVMDLFQSLMLLRCSF